MTTTTLDLLDALDGFLDVVRGSGMIAATEYEPLRDAYWSAREQVDAWRAVLEPLVCYPEPAPVEDCPHPYDRDYAFLYYDPIEEGWFITRCCTVCGLVKPPGRVSPPAKKKRRPKKVNDATP